MDSPNETEYINDAFLFMASIQRKLGNPKIAQSIYKDLLDINGGNEKILDVVEHLIADSLREEGKAEEAYAAYTLLIQKGFGSHLLGQAKFNRAMALMDLNRYEDARIELENILNGDPLDRMRPDATYMIAATYFDSGSFSASVVGYEKAMQLFPKFPDKAPHLLRLAKAYEAVSVKSDAQDTYKNLLEHFPDSSVAAEARYQLAKLYYNDRRYEEAKKELIRLDADFPLHALNAAGKYLLGDVYFADSKFASAERQYRIAAINQPAGIEAIISKYKRSQCLKELKKDTLLDKYFKDLYRQHKRSQETLEALAEKDRPTFTKYIYKILFEYGNFLIEKERYEPAIKVLDQLVTEYPEGENRTHAQYMIGKVYEQTNQKEKAVSQYEQVLQSGGEAFWIEQAKFNLDSLNWNEQYRERAISLGGEYLAESIQN